MELVSSTGKVPSMIASRPSPSLGPRKSNSCRTTPRSTSHCTIISTSPHHVSGICIPNFD
jgi:hypothetical protein